MISNIIMWSYVIADTLRNFSDNLDRQFTWKLQKYKPRWTKSERSLQLSASGCPWWQLNVQEMH